MANSDKNIRIQPNRNSTLFPKITFTGQSNNPITLNVLDDNSISFEGSAGQLFSINNNLSSGYIFSVNDISGLPSFRINADGTVGIAEFYGNVGIGITNPSYKFHARGDSYFSSIGNTALLLLSGTGGTIIASNSVNITLTDPARKGLVINAASVSQSANLLEWYSYGGGGAFNLSGYVRPTGEIVLGSPGTKTMSNGDAAYLSIQGRNYSEGLAIRGYNSSSNNILFEVQGNPGNQLFGIYGDGGVNAPRINVTNGTASTSTTSGALIVTGGVGIGGSVNIGSALTVSGTTRLNSSLFNIPPTSSIGASLLQSGYGPFGSYWTGNQVENGYLINGRQVVGGFIYITELSGALIGGTVNIFAEALQHFKWGKDKYVVLASTGNSVLYSTSPVGAGSSWAFATLPTTASWQRLEYGNNRFVAIATGSTAAYSLNGINWTLSTLPASIAWSDIKYGNGVFVAGAASTVAYSYDGIEWTIASNNVPAQNLTYGNGFFFANNTGNTASYSSDGINWTNVTLPSDTHRGSTYGNGVFYNIGNGTNSYYSSDLLTWITGPGGSEGVADRQTPWYVNNTFVFKLNDGYSKIVTGPSGTLDLNPRFTGDINNVEIGNVKPAAAEFTTLAASGPVRFVSGLASTNFRNGSVVITGGVGIGGTLNVNNIGIGYTGIPYNPSIAFIGTTGDPIRLNVLSNNTLSFEGRSGQLFSINNNLSSGWIFSVNDISGIPLFRANADATISMAEYAGNVGIGLSNPTFKFQVNGSASIGGTLSVNNISGNLVYTPPAGNIGGTSWTYLTVPTVAGTSLNNVKYLNNRFVGFASTYIYYSNDAVTWTYSNPSGIAAGKYITDIGYGEGRYVYTINNGNFVGHGTNLTNWSTASVQNQDWAYVVYGNNRFVAINYGSTGAASTDGISWTQYSLNLGFTNGLNFLNGFFYAYSDSAMFRSTDGITWNQLTAPAYPRSLAYGNGLYIGGVYNSSTHVFSYDGVNFSTYTGSARIHVGAYYFNGVYYLTSNGGQIKYSTDGFNWSEVSTSVNGFLSYAQGRLWVGSGTSIWYSNPTSNIAFINPTTSSNLDNIEIGRYTPNSANFIDVSVNNSLNVSSTYNSTSPFNGALTVAGGVGIGGTLNASRIKAASKITFEPGTGTSAVSGWSGIGLTSLSKMIYAGGRFVGVGGSYVAYSTDGVNFTYTTISGSTSASAYVDVAYGNGVYVAVNQQDSPFIAYSYDAASWGTTSIDRGLIRTVGFGNGRFLAFGEANAAVYSSTNGRNWSIIGIMGEFGREVYFANGYFISARGANLYHSVDGTSWKRANTPGSNMIFASTYGKGTYLAADYNSAQYYTSTDLVTWTQRSIDNRVWTGASYVNGVFYLIPNNHSAIYHSLDGINWSTTSFSPNIGGTQKMFTANDRLYLFSSIGPTLWSTDATTGTLMAKPFYNGELENTRIGAVNPDSATFTNLTALNPVTFTSATASTATDNGALVVTNGVGIGGTTNLNTLRVNQDLVFTPTTGTTALASGLSTATLPSIPGAPGNIRIRAVTFGNGRFVGGASTSIIWSDDAINWNRVNTPFTTGTFIQAIAYGNGTWVASSTQGTELIYSLNNGITWSLATIPNTNPATLVYGNGIFILGGNSYTGISTNGINWTTYGAVYNPDRFINGYFYTTGQRSADGYNWQSLNIPVNSSISYGNGMYFAAQYNSANYYYSYDGVNFSTTTIGFDIHVNSAYYNGVYYLTTQHNFANFKYSTDGFNYTSVGYPNGSTNYAIAAGNNKIVLFNTLYTDTTNYIYYAEASFGKANIQPFREGTIDNVTIGSRIPQAGTFNNVSVLKNLNVNSNFQSVSSNTGALTVLGGAGIGQTLNVAGSVNISNSLNLVNTTTGIATTWTRTVVGTAATISYLAYANNLYVGVGYSSLTSTDGINWTTRTLPNDLSFVSYGNGIWSGLLYGSALGATSTNGTSWTSYAMTNNRAWTMMAFGNGKFVTLARSTNIAAYSTNGYNWTEVTMPTSQVWVWVTYGGGYFVGVANGSATAVYSADGINWNTTTLPSAGGWGRITYGNGYYFVVGSGNLGAYSKDLINWTNYPLAVNGGNTLYSEYNNGTFVVVDVSIGTNSNIITGDFSSRTAVAIPFTQSLAALVAGDRNFIAGYGQTFYTFPIPNNSITLSPNTTGEINNVEIGNIKPAAGNFSNIFSQGLVAIGATTRSTSPFNGSLTVSGGVGIGGTLNANSVVTYNRLQNQSFSGTAVGSSDGLMGNFSSNYQYQSYGNGIYVVSSGGANNARYSTDGVTWQNTTLPVNQAYPINFYGNGYFVLSASGSTTVLYSTNGNSWSQVSIGNTFDRTSGVYGNGKYIIVGSGSTYNYSANLTTWNSATLPYNSNWYITYGNGMFVALGNGTRNLLYSYDGLNWSLGNVNTASGPWSGIKYGNGVFVASSLANPSSNTSGTIYSYDGINWYQGSISNQDFYNVSYGNGVYFGNNQNAFWTSTDGANWSSATSFSFSGHSFQSAYAFNKFNTVGRFVEGPTNTVTLDPKFTGEINNVRIGAITPASGDFTNLSSTGSANLVGTVNANNLNILSKVNQTPVLGGFAGTDGWTSPVLIASDNNYALAFGNGLFVQIRKTTNSINFSSDGRRWTGSTMPFTGDWNGVTWGIDKFVAVSGTGTTGAFSRNGISWTSMNMPSTAQGWIAVTYGDDKFVAVGNTSTSAYSSDGITWTGSSIANTTWTAVAYGNGTFVAVAGWGRSAAYSHDGIAWNLVNLPTNQSFSIDKKITYGNGYFVVTTYNTLGYDYSRDGVNWSTVGVSGLNRPITYGNGIYSVLNYSNAYYAQDITSTTNWLTSNTINSTDWIAFAYGNNRFVATSYNTGAVAQIDGPSNTLNLHPKFTGDIDNVRIGAKQPAAAEFTNLAAQQPVRFTANTPSTNTTNGALVVLGGVGIGGSLNIGSDVTINSRRESNSSLSGSLVVRGGVGVTGNLNVGGSVNFSSSIFGGVSTSIVPTMTFIGQANDPITLSVLSDNSLSFDGSSGQLFSINNNLSTGWIFSISDISGLPLFRTNADGTVSMGEFGGNVGIGLTNPTYKLQVAGNAGIANTLFVSGRANIGNTSFTDLYGSSYNPIITATDTFDDDIVIQIENKSDGVNARTGLLFKNNTNNVAQLYLSGGNYGGAGLGFSEIRLYGDYPFVIDTKSTSVRASTSEVVNFDSTKMTVVANTESTSSTTGSLIVSGGAGIAKSVNIGGYLSSKPAYITAGLGADQTLTAGSDNLILFTDNSDPNAWWTGTAGVGVSHIFKPNIAGLYFVSCQVHFKTGSGSGQLNIQARKNGTAFSLSQDVLNTVEGRTLNLSGVVQLNGSTDYVDFSAYTNSSGTPLLTGEGNRQYSQAVIYKIF